MQNGPENSSGLDTTTRTEYNIIKKLPDNLEKFQKRIIVYLNQLEGHPVGRQGQLPATEESRLLRDWRDIYTRILHPYSKEQIDNLIDTFKLESGAELTPEMAAKLANWLLLVLMNGAVPEGTPADIAESVQELKKTLFQPFRFSGAKNNEEIARHYPEEVIIHKRNTDTGEIEPRYQVTLLIQALEKCLLLGYLARMFETARQYIEAHPEEVANRFPALNNLTFFWMMKEYSDLFSQSRYPHQHIVRIHPQISKIEPEESQPELEPTASLWEQMKLLSKKATWEDHFGLWRLWHRAPPIQAKRLIAPHEYLAGFLFWLNVPLVLNLFFNFYVRAFKHTARRCQEYMAGKIAWRALFQSQGDALPLLIDVPWQLSKLLFAPIFLIGPIVQGATSFPLILLRAIWQHQWEPNSLMRASGFVLLDLIDSAKDAALLVFSLYGWSLLLSYLYLAPTLGAMATLAAGTLTVGTTLMLLFGLTHLPFALIAKMGYQNPLVPLFNLFNSSLLRLLWVFTMVSAPLTLLVLGGGRLFMAGLNGWQPQSQPQSEDDPENNPEERMDELARILVHPSEPHPINPPPLLSASLPIPQLSPSQPAPQRDPASVLKPLQSEEDRLKSSWFMIEKEEGTSSNPKAAKPI